MTSREKQSPSLMDQYNTLKRRHGDAVLLCRVGDFYEAFNEDAELISRVLGIALTGRDKDKNGNRVPMSGVPHHSLDSHLYKLVKAGYKVAICEQMEDAKKAKGLVKRDVVRVVTPGTVTDLNVLDQKANNYLCAIHYQKRSSNSAMLKFIPSKSMIRTVATYSTKPLRSISLV